MPRAPKLSRFRTSQTHRQGGAGVGRCRDSTNAGGPRMLAGIDRGGLPFVYPCGLGYCLRVVLPMGVEPTTA